MRQQYTTFLKEVIDDCLDTKYSVDERDQYLCERVTKDQALKQRLIKNDVETFKSSQVFKG